MKEYMLSVIIPTKNRQYYCLNSVKQILACYSEEVEIVVQDNSDNRSLEEKIKELKCDNVVYQYIEGILSFVDNFDMAIQLATGKYLMLIGDDDGITSLALKTVKWADKEGISSIRPALSFIYFWPGSKVFKEKDDGVLEIYSYNGRVREYDPQIGLKALLKNSCQNYLDSDLIKLYHGIVRRDLLESIKKKTSRYVGGLSPDIYLSVALSLSSEEKAISLDVPLTISGICMGSGSSQSATGEHTGKLEDAPHFRGHESYEWNESIPRFYSVETIWGDSAMAAVYEINPYYKTFYRPETITYRCLKKYPKYKYEIMKSYVDNGGNRLRLGLYASSRVVNKVVRKLIHKDVNQCEKKENDIATIEAASQICESWIKDHSESILFLKAWKSSAEGMKEAQVCDHKQQD